LRLCVCYACHGESLTPCFLLKPQDDRLFTQDDRLFTQDDRLFT
jgi:hypothetical protein